jgi:hypothetical protein
VSAFGKANSQLLLDPIWERSKTMLNLESKQSDILSKIRLDKPFGAGYGYLCGGDVIASHAVSLASHVTLLILLKGSFDSLGNFVFEGIFKYFGHKDYLLNTHNITPSFF